MAHWTPLSVPAATEKAFRREAWLDNLRVAVVVGVVGAHVSLIYALDVAWYYEERRRRPCTSVRTMKWNRATRALAMWVKERGQELGGDAWEAYLSDPSEESDPAKWRTEIVQPYRPA